MYQLALFLLFFTFSVSADETCLTGKPLYGLERELSGLLEPVHQLRAKEESSAIKMLRTDPILSDIKSPIEFCLSNDVFKKDLVGKYHSALTTLEKKYPNAVDNRREEVCIIHSEIPVDDPALDVLMTRFNQYDQVTLEVHVPLPADKKAPEISRVHLTLRAAALGAMGAVTLLAGRPILDELSNKGGGLNINLVQGAIIGMIADYLQRISGRTDEESIALVNYGSAVVAGLVQTKDPNVIGLSIGLTLSQMPAFQKSLDKLAANVPEKLDWRIPLAMIGTFYLLQKKQPEDPISLNKNKIYGAGTFGAVSYAVAITKKNETAGFIVASAASLLDEICDHVSQKCQGRFSYSDFLANTAGAAAGAYASRILPKETLLTYYNKTLRLTFAKKF